MSFDFPASAPKKRKARNNEITEVELKQLRAIPTFAFFEKLPESVIDTMEAASKQIRAQRLTPRGSKSRRIGAS